MGDYDKYMEQAREAEARRKEEYPREEEQWERRIPGIVMWVGFALLVAFAITATISGAGGVRADNDLVTVKAWLAANDSNYATYLKNASCPPITFDVKLGFLNPNDIITAKVDGNTYEFTVGTRKYRNGGVHGFEIDRIVMNGTTIYEYAYPTPTPAPVPDNIVMNVSWW